MPTLRAAGCSDRGPARTTNEDAFLEDPTLGLLVVADGMGGHAAGEVASSLAVDAAVRFLRASHVDNRYPWPCGVDLRLSLNANRLRTALLLANQRVFRVSRMREDFQGMGTTMVAALAADQRLVVAHVGDSRLYLLTPDGLAQLTRDDSWAAAVLGQSVGDGPRVAAHPMRNVLTNALGTRQQTDVHVQEEPIAPGDRLLLCTDGLYGAVDSWQIQAILAESRTPDAAAAELVQTALARGTSDNVTALVAFCENAGAPS